jgi:hypothetical protein
VKHFEARKYNLKNSILKQFSAFNGRVLMGPEAKDMFAKIIDNLNKTGLQEKLHYSHFTDDLMIPIFIAKSFKDSKELDKELEEYWQDRIGWDDILALENGRRQETIDALRQLYTLIAETINPDIQIGAFVPPPGEEIFKLGPRSARTGRIRNQIDHAAISSAIKSPSSRGGIDLNFQPQFIQRSSQVNPVSIQQAVFADMPDGFKGFKFNIVRFTSQLTINGAFQLMLNSD